MSGNGKIDQMYEKIDNKEIAHHFNNVGFV
jgi:hypothetical protein